MKNENYDIDETLKQYFRTLKDFKPLSKKEEHELISKYKYANDIGARNRVINSNLRYACKLASSFRNYGVSYSDLISEANNGLIEAIDKFDLSRDVKLISYSKWWIIQKMQLAIERKKRMPESDIPEHEEAPIVDDDTMTANESKKGTIDDAFLIDTEVEEEKNEEKEFVSEIMKCLNKRETDMVRMYFGMNGEQEKTLEEIGRKYNLTKERVRQIIESSFTKMRSMSMLVDSKYLSR